MMSHTLTNRFQWPWSTHQAVSSRQRLHLMSIHFQSPCYTLEVVSFEDTITLQLQSWWSSGVLADINTRLSSSTLTLIRWSKTDINNTSFRNPFCIKKLLLQNLTWTQKAANPIRSVPFQITGITVWRIKVETKLNWNGKNLNWN